MIEDIEKYLECVLPKSYRAFILFHNKEMEGKVYLYLAKDLVERNECYGIKEYAPGYVNIGNNGGGEAFILKLGEDDPEVSIVGHGSMDPKLKELVSQSFSRWLELDFRCDND
ncbi:SMI1/KNR4 family protein [Microbulbifer sp. OS29]|uniref:SMI1/KNR4 family protein n=1 Tax=Microbulbifer okhotskensis TaxID=2926617 RepID=A0A9X2ER48_9GAMM|nr:SMI1/KNR4 family protein [Microbulbifer okhotskensis]MCO1335855.1 SMI1/KNR4 family protein [Microbulbifer okhotskensis]